MAVRVRLTRVGSKKNPVWRVVVADQRSPRDGRIIEQIGHYDARPDPSRIVIDHERLEHWLQRGAEPTNTVRKLMRAPNTPAPVARSEPEPSEAGGAAVAVAAEPDAGEEVAAAADGAPDADASAAEERAPDVPSAEEPAPDATAADTAPDESS